MGSASPVTLKYKSLYLCAIAFSVLLRKKKANICDVFGSFVYYVAAKNWIILAWQKFKIKIFSESGIKYLH